METTLNTLITLMFFAPMAALVAIDLLTHRTTGPAARMPSLRQPSWRPLPPATALAVANESRYLEAA
jgi:hypothetical protein